MVLIMCSCEFKYGIFRLRGDQIGAISDIGDEFSGARPKKIVDQHDPPALSCPWQNKPPLE
jgi:hypothetical protein